MRISYDREEDILMIETLQEGTLDHAEQSGSFIAHFGKEGQLLLLEILDASEVLASLVKVAVRGSEDTTLVAAQVRS